MAFSSQASASDVIIPPTPPCRFGYTVSERYSCGGLFCSHQATFSVTGSFFSFTFNLLYHLSSFPNYLVFLYLVDTFPFVFGVTVSRLAFLLIDDGRTKVPSVCVFNFFHSIFWQAALLMCWYSVFAPNCSPPCDCSALI